VPSADSRQSWRHRIYGAAGAERLGGVLAQWRALAILDLDYNMIGAAGAESQPVQRVFGPGRHYMLLLRRDDELRLDWEDFLDEQASLQARAAAKISSAQEEDSDATDGKHKSVGGASSSSIVSSPKAQWYRVCPP